MARKKNAKLRDTRSAILQAAYTLFLDRGYHATSMRQIASKVGLTVAAAYNHFKNKEEVYAAVLRAHRPYANFLPALAQDKGESVEAFVREAARLMIEGLDREPGFLKLMFIEVVEFKSKHIPAFFRELFPQLIALAKKFSGRRGRLRRIPPHVLVRSFIGLFFSYAITELLIWKYLPPSMQSDCLDDFVDIYLHGVIAPAPAASE